MANVFLIFFLKSTSFFSGARLLILDLLGLESLEWWTERLSLVLAMALELLEMLSIAIDCVSLGFIAGLLRT